MEASAFVRFLKSLWCIRSTRYGRSSRKSSLLLSSEGFFPSHACDVCDCCNCAWERGEMESHSNLVMPPCTVHARIYAPPAFNGLPISGCLFWARSHVHTLRWSRMRLYSGWQVTKFFGDVNAAESETRLRLFSTFNRRWWLNSKAGSRSLK